MPLSASAKFIAPQNGVFIHMAALASVLSANKVPCVFVIYLLGCFMIWCQLEGGGEEQLVVHWKLRIIVTW